MRNKKTSEAGFTLIELMIIVVIIAIISMFANSMYSKSVQKSRRAEGKARPYYWKLRPCRNAELRTQAPMQQI